MQLSKLLEKKTTTKRTKSKYPTMRPRAKLNPFDDSQVWCVLQARGEGPVSFFFLCIWVIAL